MPQTSAVLASNLTTATTSARHVKKRKMQAGSVVGKLFRLELLAL